MIKQRLGEAKASAMAKDNPMKDMPTPTREDIGEAMEEYLAKGGTVTYLEPEYPDPNDKIIYDEDDITTYISPKGELLKDVEKS